jgi:hypothetical protein
MTTVQRCFPDSMILPILMLFSEPGSGHGGCSLQSREYPGQASVTLIALHPVDTPDRRRAVVLCGS